MGSHLNAIPNVRSWKWSASHDRVARLAYHFHMSRNAAAGHVVHGHDLDDYELALSEKTRIFANPVNRAEFQVTDFSFQPMTWWDAIKWNRLVIKILSNDYFPLLRLDDCPLLGDRISPFHAMDLLIQREGIIYRDRGLTEDEWDDLKVYRQSFDEITEYCRIDLCERRGLLLKRLNFTANARYHTEQIAAINEGFLTPSEIESVYDVIAKYDQTPTHDIEYVMEGKPYEPVVYPSVGPKIFDPEDLLPRRIPTYGDKVYLVSANTTNARHPTLPRSLKVGDEFIVRRVNVMNGMPILYYYDPDGLEQYVYSSSCKSKTFVQTFPPGWTPYYTPPVVVPEPDNSYRPDYGGVNAHSNCLLAEPKFQYTYRVTPRHLADLVALRFLGIINSQQTKILMDLVWDNFGWYDVFHHIREEGMLDEVSGDLREIISGVLSSQEQAVKDYKGGKKAAFGRLMGATMKACEGKGKPQEIKGILEEMLS